MNNSQITRLSVIAVIAASLLAVGVVAAISMTEEAEARVRQSNSASVTQSATSSSGIASNSASVTQSNTAVCPNPPGCD